MFTATAQRMLRHTFVTVCLASLFAFVACQTGTPKARVLTAADLASLKLGGDAVDAKVGDTVMENDQLLAVIQKPGRDIGPAPYGGNLIDLVRKPDRIDRFGELQPFFNLGRTADFKTIKVINDGRNGADIVVEAQGKDAVWDYINIAAIQPDLLQPFVRFDANQAMGMDVTVRYTLPVSGKNSDTLQVEYRLGEAKNVEDAMVGFAVDTGGAVDFFSPSTGFGALRSFDSNFLSGATPTGNFFGIVGQGVAYGVRALPNAEFKNPMITVAAVGIAVSVLGTDSLLTALTTPNTKLSKPRVFSLELTPRAELDEVVRAFDAYEGAGKEVSGRVLADQINREAGIRVNAFKGGIIASSTTVSADGSFKLLVPEGEVVLQAETASSRSALLPVGGDFHILPLGMQYKLSVDIKSREGLDSSAPLVARTCKVTAIGERAFVSAPGASVRNLNRVSSNVLSFLLPTCNTERDGGIFLPNNRYLIQVTRGPEYQPVRAVWNTNDSGSLVLQDELKRVVDRGSFVAADFHQHTINSPDSVTPLTTRLFGNISEGIDFFTSSDHDRVTDFAPLVAEYGLGDVLGTATGVELTTFPFGHFNAWPLMQDADRVSNGSVDWATGTEHALLPSEIFSGFEARGAQIIQANHPRTTSSITYQAYFDRAALVVDPDNGVFSEEQDYRFIPPSILRLPDNQAIFSRNFNTFELMNGFPFDDEDGRPLEVEADAVMRDWLGFLAFGFHPTAVGVSDVHGLNGGYPRTYVDLRSDSRSGAPTAQQVSAALLSGHAVASNGALVRMTVGDATQRFAPGERVPTPALGTTVVDVVVEGNADYDIDRIELFVNTRVMSPGLLNEQGEIVRPKLVPTHAQDVVSELVTRAHGGVMRRSHARFDIPVSKGFVIARVRGKKSLYPFLPYVGSGRVNPEGSTPDDFFSETRGAPAYAITNAVLFE